MAFLYYRYTKDTPAGNYKEIEREVKEKKKGSFMAAMKDYRTWILALAYAACFGIEITVDNVAAIYFVDNFNASLILAGTLAGIFGFMNIFARALGGIFSDKIGKVFGMKGKGLFLGAMLLLEGLGIIFFAQSGNLTMAIFSMLLFALFLKMANGATYSIVPFVNKEAMGSVAGIVGAGGNIGAMLVGFLFKSESISYSEAFFYIGAGVAVIGVIVFITRFQPGRETTDATINETVLNPA
jgi:NNP family nitrate/nitrite transporter-like MFS transporter